MDSSTPDPYVVLVVDRDADIPAIRSAYRKLILKCHPDKVEDPALKAVKQDEFQRVQQAYELLSDETRRADYDYKTKPAFLKAERDDFVAFALKLFDEAKQRKVPDGSSSKETRSKSPPAPSSKSKHEPESIEDEIKERNKAFEDLKAGAPAPATTATDAPDRAGAKNETRARSVDKLPKREKLFAVPVEQLNLQVMNPEQEDPRVDIVAVHGLGAIPDITWMERVSGIDWLSHKDMLPRAVPEARILRFGYDSLWMGKTPIRTSLSTIAYKLLLSLYMRRMEDLERPLVFIGHCFGGLVIERALNLAKMRQNAYPGVFDSSVEVIFLGTPQRGTNAFSKDSALLAAIAASSDLSQNLETGVLGAMTSESGELLDMAADFITLCVDGGPMVTCFYEQRASKLGKVIGRDDIEEFIVDSTSATFDGHDKFGLELDHFSLNKFNGPKNPNYLQVRAQIVRFYEAALERPIKSSTLASPAGFNAANEAMTDSKISTEKPTASQAWNQLRRQRAAHGLRPASPQPSASSSRRGQVEAKKSPAAPKSRAQGNPNRAQSLSSIGDKEEELRKAAIKELHEEEAKKEAASREEEYQKRLDGERRAAEQQYLERLKKNMRKYGIENPEEILEAKPIPRDEDLSEQEIKDKEKWYKNFLKGVLSDYDLDGGKIDEILNNTGETMVIDNIETTFTKMAKKWISKGTLDGYHIPWQYDKDDPSSIIIKRWVPDYEQAFLWDHSYALREGRERKTRRDDDRTKNEKERRDEPGKDWLLRMWESFKAAPKKTVPKTVPRTPVYYEYAHYDRVGEKTREAEGKRWQERETERERQKERERARNLKDKDRDKKRDKRPRQPYVELEDEDEDLDYPRRPKRSGTTPASPSFYEPYVSTPIGAAPSYERRRAASSESIYSAPDINKVNHQRQHSRTLSNERQPKRQASTEHTRPRSSDPDSERLRRQPSGESRGRRHRDVTHRSPAPLLRRADTYTVDDTRYKRRDSPEVLYSPTPKDDFNYARPKVKTAPGYGPGDVAYSASSQKSYAPAPYYGEVPQKSPHGYYVVD